VIVIFSKNQNAPIEGIETRGSHIAIPLLLGKNQNAPIEGIETPRSIVPAIKRGFVRIKMPRLRGLKLIHGKLARGCGFSKNQNAPIEGIETSIAGTIIIGGDGKNQNAPIEGIETTTPI